MLFMFILMLFGFVSFILYNILILRLNHWEIPESVSATSYILQDKSKTGANGFTYICLIVALTFLPLWLTVTPDNWQFLSFICCAGVVFAGTTPFFKERFQGIIHYTSGIISAISYIAWCVAFGQWYWVVCILGMIGLSLIIERSYKNFVYWTEIYGVIILVLILTLQTFR